MTDSFNNFISDQSISSLLVFMDNLNAKLESGDNEGVLRLLRSPNRVVDGFEMLDEMWDEVSQHTMSDCEYDYRTCSYSYIECSETVEPCEIPRPVSPSASPPLLPLSQSDMLADPILNRDHMLDLTVVDESLELQPGEVMFDQPFKLFNAVHLLESTVFDKHFEGRKTAYYGELPYSYSGVTHPARDFKENTYLCKLLNYVDIVKPGISYNSAMVNVYPDGSSHIPYHSDNEEEIMAYSDIFTISLGAHREMHFRHINSKMLTHVQQLQHGDMLTMTKSSQHVFAHSIPADILATGMRISITLRLIQRPPIYIAHSDISSEPYPSPATSFIGEYAAPPPYLPPTADGYQQEPHLSPNPPDHTTQIWGPDNIHPSRQARHWQADPPVKHSASKKVKPVVISPIGRKSSTIYIGDSMFRHLHTDGLSSEKQSATKFFYPGETAGGILKKLKSDASFIGLNGCSIGKVVVVAGTNDVDGIYYDKRGTSLEDSYDSITNLITFLKRRFPSSEVKVLNILPRKVKGRNDIIMRLNQHIKRVIGAPQYLDTADNAMFSYRDGSRREQFFVPRGRGDNDNPHLNRRGVARVAKFLKYVVHVG